MKVHGLIVLEMRMLRSLVGMAHRVAGMRAPAGTRSGAAHWRSMLRFSACVRLLPASLLVVVAVIQPCAANSESGYAGSILLGRPVTLEWAEYAIGAQALAEQGARIAGQQRYAGYRFRSGFAIEASQYRAGPIAIGSAAEAVGVAGLVSLPLTARIVATGKAGIYVAENGLWDSFGYGNRLNRGTVLGAGVRISAKRNLTFSLESQQLQGGGSSSLSALSRHTVFLGAQLRF